jgi:alcohol dehydrogenase YqhD (iron-dependent ADH family)
MRASTSARRDGADDFLLAVGGGSVIDTAKAIGVRCALRRRLLGLFPRHGQRCAATLPVGVVLTILAAAGSEGSNSRVITREEGKLKWGIRQVGSHPAEICGAQRPAIPARCRPIRPPAARRIWSAHVLERYFTNTPDVALTDRLSRGR